MSWVRVYAHTVFTTKNRLPFLRNKIIRDKLIYHILENAKLKNILIDTIGGFDDHLHCLISISKEITIKDTMRLIKGESSNWINKEKLLKDHFSWQDDYWMVGISENHLNQVREYINQQELHHTKITLTQELDAFLLKYGWGPQKD